MTVGVRPQQIRARNRGLVLRAVLNEGLCARTDIAERLGLTKTALTNLTAELIADGLLCEGTLYASGTVGRSRVGLIPAPDAPAIVGILIQRGAIRAIRADLRGTAQAQSGYDFDGRIKPAVFRQQLTRLYHEVADGVRICAVGVASAGPLDRATGICTPDGLFSEPYTFPAVPFFAALSGKPTYLCNDATAGAWAELLLGAGKTCAHFAYLSTRHGIGAGLVSDGRLIQSDRRSGGIGHMTVQLDGRLCTCGRRGCLEAYADASRIWTEVGAADHPLSRCATQGLSDWAKYDGPAVRDAWAAYCRYVAVALYNISLPLRLERVIVNEADPVRAPFARALAEATAAQQMAVSVVPSPFGMDAPLYGSIALVLDEIYAGRLNPAE